MKYDVIIVGGGASGLTAAISAARKGSSVLVIEHKDKAGKKLLATGNGKCNFTNRIQLPECYRSDDSAFVNKVLSCFDVQRTINFFEELGIYPRERNGYLYPNSEQAASVVQVLLLECERFGVTIIYQEHVNRITPPNYTVVTNIKSYYGKNLILATGGCASPNLGSDGSGYALAKNFGHSIIKPLPALVQLKSSEKFCKTLSGVRTPAKVIVLADEKELAKEEGEILFTDYGISGIPIMQISRFVSKALDQRKKVYLKIDYMPELTKKEIIIILNQRILNGNNKSIEQMLIGLFNHKLSYILIKEAKLDPLAVVTNLKQNNIEALVTKIKEFKLCITGTNSFEQAQVSSGGVSTKEIDPTTMESKISNGLYLVGELVDVDGTCGGYNLQWAWSSGYIAGLAAGSKKCSQKG